MSDAFERWMVSLEARHLADLRFADVSRALRAVSATYVERRQRIREGSVLSGAGKRAAFALAYGPLHFLLVREIVQALGAQKKGTGVFFRTLVDLGCGTGAASAAWGEACTRPPSIVAIDRHPWALGEAALTYRQFGLAARTRLGDMATTHLPKGDVAFLAAFAMNELEESKRERLMANLMARAAEGSSMLVVEPLAGFVAPWWKRWASEIERAGGRADEWRFRVELPPIVIKLDRASGLDHRELTGRSLWIGR